MRTPPPGTRNTMPVRPGESKTDYLARVNATKNTKPVRTGNDTPRAGTYGGVKGGGAPKPKVSRTPIRPGRPGSIGMKSGGMVKGKKK